MQGKSITEIAEIMGNNFVGKNELKNMHNFFPLVLPDKIPEITFSLQEISRKKDSHILILLVPYFLKKIPITILSLKDFFGHNTNTKIPCFYNQDWYLNEIFVKKQLECKWMLISKTLLTASRATTPLGTENLPSAVEIAYIFFSVYFAQGGLKLWNTDYIWCNDADANGDRIYVGKYTDPTGLNKEGFEIHRHLSIKNNYGMVDLVYETTNA